MAFRKPEYIGQIHPRLQAIVEELSEADMTEDDANLMAITFVNTALRRYVYVCLDLDTPDTGEIYYAFEDHCIETGEMDLALERGVITDIELFKQAAYNFLQLPPDKHSYFRRNEK